jgi:pimeloyl-ACP methyl ester carboxylesterase
MLLAVTLVAAACASGSSESTIADATSRTAPMTTTAPGFEGVWFGYLLPGIRIQFQFERNQEGRLIGVLDSIGEGVLGIPIDEIVESGDTMQIWMAALESSATFTLDGDQLEGTLTTGSKTIPVSLVRRDEPFTFERSQVPEPPYPYVEEEIVFPNADAGFDLAGTLTIPEGDGPFPAVVLISGSGPQDRDEQLAGHRPFLVLADHLTRAGIAVLRYDDRGYGESGGDLEGTSADLATDASAAFEYLSARPETGSVGLLGHSEGGMIAPLVAIGDPAVAFVVMLAGPGETGAELLIQQAGLIPEAEGVPQDIVDWQVAFAESAIAAAASDLDDDAATTEMRRISEEAMASAPPSIAGSADVEDLIAGAAEYLTPWMRYFLRFDPRPVLAALEVPVLALFGEVDLQVPAVSNAAAVDASLTGDHPATEVVIVPGVNHLFQHSETGKVTEYAHLTETMAPEVLERISAWILLVTDG